jgi:hypothetical protein
MTERQLQDAVVELCQWLGYLVYHTYDSRRSQPGFPDLVIVGRKRVIFAELKSDKGKLSGSQAQWYAHLLANGAEAYVWRPTQWKDETIKQVLSEWTDAGSAGSRPGTTV